MTSPAARPAQRAFDWAPAEQMPAPFHRTLERQLRRLGIDAATPPNGTQWSRLLVEISESYAEADNDRYMLERAIEISSEEMRGLNDKLVDLAQTDVLTGLPNRVGLLTRLNTSLASLVDSESLSLLFVDLDGFKLVNDTRGHAFGDQLLVQVSQRIQATVRGVDHVFRLGGDEFVVICHHAGDVGAGGEIATRLVEVIDAPFQIAGEGVHVGASIGVVPAESGIDGEMLIRRADLAMYAAKSLGRGRWAAYADHMSTAALERVDVESQLRQAIDDRQLVVHLQPVVCLATGDIVGAESLVRWRRTGVGIVPPDRFIPIAEESTLIHSVTAEVLRLALEAAASWQRTDIDIGVNLSARDLQMEGLCDRVVGAADGAGVAVDRLVVEITESALLAECPVLTANLSGLHEMGVKVAIDDFGRGYSSLSHLRDLPISILKIDKTFIDEIDSSLAATSIVKAIIEMGVALNLLVVAEGVERESQLDVLRSLGCYSAQGYLFARPVPVEMLAESMPAAFAC